jgi:hypothetical protein
MLNLEKKQQTRINQEILYKEIIMGKRLLPGKTIKDKGKTKSHRRPELDRTKFIGTKYEIFTMQSEANKLIKRENMKAKKLRRKIKHG